MIPWAVIYGNGVTRMRILKDNDCQVPRTVMGIQSNLR